MDIPLLTPGESKVYQALLDLGESQVGAILHRAGVSHSKLYDILQRLARKGLVSTTTKNGKQSFSAADPLALNRLVEHERTHVDTAANAMRTAIERLSVRGTQRPSALASFEGIDGMKTVLEAVLRRLKKGDEVLILGAPRNVDEYAGGYLKDWQKRRIKLGAVCKILTDADSHSWDESWWRQSKKDNLTFTKRSGLFSPAYLIIAPGMVATIHFTGTVLTFLIESDDIAKRYQEFFKAFWKG